MNIEEAKELVDSSKIVKIHSKVVDCLPYVNWKGYAIVCGYDGKDNTFSLVDYYTDEHLGWFDAECFSTLEYEYIDDYKQAVKEHFDGKYVEMLYVPDHWEEVSQFTLKELKLCGKFRVKFN